MRNNYKIGDNVFVSSLGCLIIPVKIIKQLKYWNDESSEHIMVKLLSNNSMGYKGELKRTSRQFILGYATIELMKIENAEKLLKKIKCQHNH